jgi:DNA replication protein DnaC
MPSKCPYQGMRQVNKDVVMCSKWLDYNKGMNEFLSLAPAEFHNVSFESFDLVSEDLKMAIRKAKLYINKQLFKNNIGLFFYGNYGTGKTRLAYTVIKEIAQRGYKIGIFDSFKDLQTINAAQEKAYKLEEADVIFIDDLGSKQNYDWVLEAYRRIIINVHDSGYKGIIITSNFAPEQILNTGKEESYLDKRSSSRLLKMLPTKSFQRIQGKDYRLKKANKLNSLWD